MVGRRETKKEVTTRSNHWRGRGKMNWVDLPEDVTLLILTKVGEEDTLGMMHNALNVCSSWRQFAKEPCLYRRVSIREDGKGGRWRRLPSHVRSGGLPNFAKQIIDRSCGHMEKLSCDLLIMYKKDFVNYMTTRLKSLNSLQLWFTDGEIVDGVAQVANRFPLLEELELRAFRGFPIQVIQQVAQLKKFKYLHLDYVYCRDDPRFLGDINAVAIAQHLPHLRRLQLSNTTLTFQGLQAILSGCPHLEYLRLQGCKHHLVDPQGNSFNNCVVVGSGIMALKVQVNSTFPFGWVGT